MTKKTKIARSSGARRARDHLPLGGVARIRMLNELELTDPALRLRLAAGTPEGFRELDALIRAKAETTGRGDGARVDDNNRESGDFQMTSVCVCCGESGKYNILLAVGPEGGLSNRDRFYLPNEMVRQHIGTPDDVTEKVHFCRTCMRAVEDSMRATILYLKAERRTVTIAGDEQDWGQI